jgi:predicted transposase YdaD
MEAGLSGGTRMAEHDSGYKLLFSHAKMVEDLLRGFVREGWVEDLDFTTLERVNESFTSDGLEQRHADMAWRLQSKSVGKGWLYVYFLLEFQSTSDPFMAVRLLAYVALLYEGLVRAKAVTLKEGLPAVVSVVLYNGKSPWRAPTDLASLYRSVPPGCLPYLPQLTYLLIDENRLAPEDLALGENRVAALFRVETLKPEGLPDLKAELAQLLPRKDEDPELRRALHRWLRRLLRRLLPGVTIPDDDFEEMPMLEETLIEWRDTARKEGLREGRQEGQIEGRRQFLLEQLEQRFGALSSKVRRKVKVSSEERLKELGKRVLVAGSLAEMGLE